MLALASYLVASAAVAMLVWGLFWRIDRASEEALRAQLACWLTARSPGLPGAGDDNGRDVAATDWAGNLSALLDRLLGSELHSRRALLWSCLLSFASMLFLLGLFLVLDLASVRMVRELDLGAEGAVQTLLAGAVFVAMMNFVPDYISLIESRFIVRRLAVREGVGIRIALIGLDAALTFFTLFGFMFLFTFLGWFLEGGLATALAEYPGFVSDFWWAIGPESEHPVQLCFYSTFSTSAVIWLYGLGSLATRDLAERAPRHPWLRGLLCGGQPIRAIGASAALIAFLTVLALCFVVAPGAHWDLV